MRYIDWPEVLKKVAGVAVFIFCLYAGLTLFTTGDIGMVFQMVINCGLVCAGVAVAGVAIYCLIWVWREYGDDMTIPGALLGLLYVAVSTVLMHQLGYHIGYRVLVWGTEQLTLLMDKFQMPVVDVTDAQFGCGIAGVVACLLVGLVGLKLASKVRNWLIVAIMQALFTMAFCFYPHVVVLIVMVLFAMLLAKVFGAIGRGFEEYNADRRYTTRQAARASMSLFGILRHWHDEK